MLAATKDPGQVVAEVLMTRQVSATVAFLVVEGRDDRRFWLTHTEPDASEIIDSHGKPNALEAIKRLDARGFAGALGFVDDDYDALRHELRVSRNLVSTDAHDLECMQIRSGALDHVLAECGSASKISDFERR